MRQETDESYIFLTALKIYETFNISNQCNFAAAFDHVCDLDLTLSCRAAILVW